MLSVGFDDHSYFSKAFKEAYGCSPRDFKKQNIRDNISQIYPSVVYTLHFPVYRTTIKLLSNNRRFNLSKWDVFCICAYSYMKNESIILLPIILCILVVIEIIIMIFIEILWVVIIMSIILSRFTG